MSLLDHYDPDGWRFYHYGTDDDGEPLFSFWMDVDDDTGVCIYERNAGAGKWLSTDHSDDEYAGVEPSDGLKEILCEVVGPDGYVDSERVEALVEYEAYFFRIVYGTVEQKQNVPPELLAFLEDITDSTLRIEP